MVSGLFYVQTRNLQIIYVMYMYKPDLALNNRQRLLCRKTQIKNNVLNN